MKEIEEELEDFGAIDFPEDIVIEEEKNKSKDKVGDKDNLQDDLENEDKEDKEEENENESGDNENEEDDDLEDEEEDSNKSKSKQTKSKEKGEASEEDTEDEPLDDEDIIEKYGKDVKPEIVRHFSAIKERLYLDEGFKFTGKNIDEAYEQDEKNRNQLIAQNLVGKLPEKAKAILSVVIKAGVEISDEAFDKILEAGKAQIAFDFNTDDEDKNLDNAKRYLAAIYSDRGLKPKAIATIIEDLEDTNEVIKEAKEEKDKFDKEYRKIQEKEVEQARQSKIETQKKAKLFVSEIDKVLEKEKYTPQRKEVIRQNIFSKKDTGDTVILSKLKSIYNNPKAIVILSDLVSDYDEKTGEWKRDTTKKTKTEVVNEFKKNIEEKLSGNSAFKAKGQSRRNTSDINWEEVEI